jgi:hypothetical protein
MKKTWIAAAAALLLLLGGIYLGSPYYAAYSLREAARDGDIDRLEAKVDFPAVRESLKSQLSGAMVREMQDEPGMRNNPFAGLGAVLLPALGNRLVDAFVTPDAIAALVRGRKPSDRGRSESEMESRTEYLSLDRFRVTLRDRKRQKDGPALLFERRGFATWKLVSLELPADLLRTKL